MKKAIIACEIFYKELTDIIKDKELDLQLLPQGLHNLPQSEKMRKIVQEKIDFLESQKNYKYLFLGYGNCSGGTQGLKTKNAKLVIPKVHDCIPLLLGNLDLEENVESRKTYYLSRGWIDCGGDPYKQYMYLINKTNKLEKKFKSYEKKHKKALITWYNKEKYISQKKYSKESAKYICGECIKNYNSVTVIDNNNLDNIHKNYARKMYNFLNNLMKDQYNKALDFKEIKGTLNLLENLVNFEALPENKKTKFVSTPSGESLNLEKHLY